MRLRTLLIASACVLCGGALAEERASVPEARQPSGLAALLDRKPLEEERLAELRGRLATPAELQQQAGVVLWDEPRKGAPPVRSGAEPGVNASVTTSFTIHRVP